MLRAVLLLQFATLTLVLSTCTEVDAATVDGPKWSMKVVTFGKTRQTIKNKPIHLRPNRPLHCYGNTQRRSYHRKQTSHGLAPRYVRPTVGTQQKSRAPDAATESRKSALEDTKSRN